MKSPKTLKFLKNNLMFLVIFILFLLKCWFFLDPDFGWHLRSGQHFLANGIPANDIFTFSASDFAWINHEWLSDIILATLNNLGGFIGLAIFYALLWTFSVWAFARSTNWILTLAATLAILPFAGVRAITWSAFLLALLYLILSAKNHNWRFLILPLFLLWANLHGSFLLGLAFVFWTALKQKSPSLITFALISLLLTLVNPYQINLYEEIFRTMLDSDLRHNILEWKAFAFPLVTAIYAIAWLAIYVNYAQKDFKKYFSFDGLLFAMSALSMRMLPIFGLFSLHKTQERLQKISGNLGPKAKYLAQKAGLILLIIMFLATLKDYWPNSSQQYNYPAKIVTKLDNYNCQPNLFNSYNYGGYLIWKAPNYKVYIDGRMPSWQSGTQKYMDDYFKIVRMEEADFYKQIFSKYSINCAVLEKNSALVEELQKQNWRVAEKDGGAWLLVNN